MKNFSTLDYNKEFYCTIMYIRFNLLIFFISNLSLSAQESAFKTCVRWGDGKTTISCLAVHLWNLVSGRITVGASPFATAKQTSKI